jgi:hypothetical protein
MLQCLQLVAILRQSSTSCTARYNFAILLHVSLDLNAACVFADIDGFKLLEIVGLEMDIPVISELHLSGSSRALNLARPPNLTSNCKFANLLFDTCVWSPPLRGHDAALFRC